MNRLSALTLLFVLASCGSGQSAAKSPAAPERLKAACEANDEHVAECGLEVAPPLECSDLQVPDDPECVDLYAAHVECLATMLCEDLASYFDSDSDEVPCEAEAAAYADTCSED